MTLLILAVAAAAMADVSRRSMRRALDANAAEQSLQQKWAATSLRQTLLPRAAGVLDESERRTRVANATVRADFTLGEGPSLTPVSLLFGDEGAKLNLNALYERDRTGFRRRAETLAGPLRVEPRPTPPSRDELAESPPPFESFGQVFDNPPPVTLAAVSADVTLWGGRQLNYRRAGPAALLETLRPILGRGEVDRLIQLRNAPRGSSLPDVLDALSLPQRDRDAAAARLVGESSTFSLWVVAGPPGRQRFRFAVSENTVERGSRIIDFAW